MKGALKWGRADGIGYAKFPKLVLEVQMIYLKVKEKSCCSVTSVQLGSVAQSCPTLRPHESQHARPPCPSPTPRVHSDSRPSSQWCHPAISSSVIPFSSCPQSLPASESFPMSQLFVWGGQSTGVSALASFLPKKSQGWSPSEWLDLLAVQGTLKSLLQHHSSKASILRCSAFFTVQLFVTPWTAAHQPSLSFTVS